MFRRKSGRVLRRLALMVPSAVVRARYASLKMPIVIIAGEHDRLIDVDAQSARLPREITHSRFRRGEHAAHMVHQSATARVMAAIDEAEEPDREADGRFHRTAA